MRKAPPKQQEKFEQAARELGVDLDEEKLAETLRKLGKDEPERKRSDDQSAG